MTIKIKNNKLLSIAILNLSAICNIILKKIARNVGLIIQTNKYFIIKRFNNIILLFENLYINIFIFYENIKMIVNFFIMYIELNSILLE